MNAPFRQTEFERRQSLSGIQEIQSIIQMEDIRQLLQTPQLDMEYIKKWIGQLQLNTFNLL
ncbi:hypothetical protein GCM10027516_06320 [Niabella aquatica]